MVPVTVCDVPTRAIAEPKVQPQNVGATKNPFPAPYEPERLPYASRLRRRAIWLHERFIEGKYKTNILIIQTPITICNRFLFKYRITHYIYVQTSLFQRQKAVKIERQFSTRLLQAATAPNRQLPAAKSALQIITFDALNFTIYTHIFQKSLSDHYIIKFF